MGALESPFQSFERHTFGALKFSILTNITLISSRSRIEICHKRVVLTDCTKRDIDKGAYGSEDWVLASRCQNPPGTSSGVRAAGQINIAMHPNLALAHPGLAATNPGQRSWMAVFLLLQGSPQSPTLPLQLQISDQRWLPRYYHLLVFVQTRFPLTHTDHRHSSENFCPGGAV